MRPGLLQTIFCCIILIYFTSCVSKKKYLKQRAESVKAISKSDKDITVLKTKADSLTFELVKRDSIIDSLNSKLLGLQTKKEKPKLYSSKKSGTITKAQEYERKSHFIYNFGAYIEWPVIYNGTDFVIGIAGDQDVVNIIQETIGSKKVGGKKLKIEKYNKVTNYHIVYVTSSQSAVFTTIKNDSKKNKTILISDDNALFSSGAHISFMMDEDKVKYTISKPMVEKIGLKVSQELMRFSE